MTFEEFQRTRSLCIQNAEDFVKGAKTLDGKDVRHIQYHLAALAVEEIGKASLIEMQYIANQRIGDDNVETGALEDHIRKLFWAFWGPSFGKQRFTQSQLDQYKGLATSVHFTRLKTLYISPSDAIHPKQVLSEQEVTNLIGIAEALVGMEKLKTPLNPDDPSVNKVDIEWFLTTSQDPIKRKTLFVGKSIDKLIELGNAKEWIHWLKTEADKEDAEIKKMFESELSREKPQGEDARKPKYKIKVKIISESHSLRNKHLVEWNKQVDFIKLSTDDKRTLFCEFTVQKSIPLQGLYWVGWAMARIFVVALNIGSRGFFWWNIPRDIEKYYEDIIDLEKNMGIHVAPIPQLSVNWKEAKLVLDRSDLANTSMMFFYITKIRGTEMEKAFNSYLGGLAFTSKNDVHLRFEPNAFEQFFIALRDAMRIARDWDGTSDFTDAVCAQFFDIFPDLASLRECISLGIEQQKSPTRQTAKPITLTEVVAIKLYCDVYLLRLAKRKIGDGIDKKIK